MATASAKGELFLRSRSHRRWRHRKSFDSVPIYQPTSDIDLYPSSPPTVPSVQITPPESEEKLWSPERHIRANLDQNLIPFSSRSRSRTALAEPELISTERSLRNLLRYFENMEDDPATRQIARVCHVLSRCLLCQGRIAEAEVFQWRSLLSNLDELGSEHPETIASMSCMSSLLYQQHKYQQAKSYGQRALENTKKVYGTSHWRTLAATKNLALVTVALQKPDLLEGGSAVTLRTSQQITPD